MKPKHMFVYQAVRFGGKYHESFSESEFELKLHDLGVVVKPKQKNVFKLIPFTNIKDIELHEPSKSVDSTEGSASEVHKPSKSKGKVSALAV